MSTVARFKMLL